MCHLLTTMFTKNSTMPDRLRMFVHLLKMPVKVTFTDSLPEAFSNLDLSDQFEILALEFPDEDSLNLYRRTIPSHPEVKRLLISDTLSASSSDEVVLPLKWDIRRFYSAMIRLMPEIAANTPPLEQSSRWYGYNVPLQERILDVMRIIREEYQNDIGLDYLAGRVYTSPCYLSTLFRKFIGMNALAYLNDYRLHVALTLLRSTDLILADVCTKIGYRSLPYFCTCFKRRFGITPSEYREGTAVVF